MRKKSKLKYKRYILQETEEQLFGYKFGDDYISSMIFHQKPTELF